MVWIKIKREEYRNTFGDLNDTTGLLRKAIERDWIIDISNHIVTIVQLRAPGLTWMRMPLFTWAQFVTSFLLVLAFN
mgnify:CR=1 FL=1